MPAVYGTLLSSMQKAKSAYFHPPKLVSSDSAPQLPSQEKLARFISLDFIPEKHDTKNYPIVVTSSDNDMRSLGINTLTSFKERQARRRELTQHMKEEKALQEERRCRQILKTREVRNMTAEANIEQILRDKRSRAFAFDQMQKQVRERAASVEPLEFKERDEKVVKEALRKYVASPGSHQWLKTTSGGRLKVNYPELEGTSAEFHEVDKNWDVFNGFVGLLEKKEDVKLLEARAKTAAQQQKSQVDTRVGQCFKLTPWEEKRSISNAFTYLHLRHEGCPSNLAMQFSSKIRCMTDSTQTLDGPARFRKILRKDNRREGPNWKGWQLHQPEFITQDRYEPLKAREEIDKYEEISEMYAKFEREHVIEGGMIMPEKVLPPCSFYTSPEYSNMSDQELYQYLRDRRLGINSETTYNEMQEEPSIEDKEVQEITSIPVKPVETGKATPITSDQTMIRNSEVTSPVNIKAKIVVFFPEINENSSSSSEPEPPQALQIKDQIEDVATLHFGTLLYRTLRPQTVKSTPTPQLDEQSREVYTAQDKLPPLREESPAKVVSMSNPVTPTHEPQDLSKSQGKEQRFLVRQEFIAKQMALERKLLKSATVQSQLHMDLIERVKIKSEMTEKRISTAQKKRKVYLKAELDHAAFEMERKKNKIQEIIAGRKKQKQEAERLAEEKRTAEKVRLENIKLMKQRQIEDQRRKTISKLKDAEIKFEQRKEEDCKRRERLTRITDARFEIAKRARG
mmetsp:Transcript_18609/g.33627  ORF Transcript_18609/g.33627 Transcript_18609/m.33627 type:complete len:740 (-) Transcript_18609:23-2242(-)